MAFRIVPIEPKHIKQVVAVHMRSFPTFFLTFLGPRFLEEFYKSFTVDPAGVGLVAEDADSGRVLGVVAGPVEPAGYFKRLLRRRWWAFCRASLIAVLRRPVVIKRLFRAFFYRGEAPEGPPRALLSSIGVDTENRGQGMGKALVDAWVDAVRNRGSTGCFLTTDAKDNDFVNRFYQRLGWNLEATYQTREGRLMNRYVLDMADSSQEGS